MSTYHVVLTIRVTNYKMMHQKKKKGRVHHKPILETCLEFEISNTLFLNLIFKIPWPSEDWFPDYYLILI